MNPIFDIPDTHRAAVITDSAQAIHAALSIAEQAKPDAVVRDQQRLYPLALLEKFTQLGLGSISIPRCFGGGGLNYQTMAEVFRIISASDPSLGQIPQNHFGLIQFLLGEGTRDQQRRLFDAVVKGKRLGNGGPEKNTLHTREIQARLTRKGHELRLSGEKFYSTGALFADILVTTALQDDGHPAMAFIPLPASGVEIIDDWTGMGQRTTASGTVRLDEVIVDPALLIPLPSAEKPSLRGAVSQLIQAAIDAGIAQGALDDALAFVQTNSRPWVDAGVERNADDPYILADIGRISTDLSAANALLRRAARVLDDINLHTLTPEDSAQASIAVAEAKVLTTEIALRASEKLLEWGGSRATLLMHGLDRHWRNARTHTLHDPVRWKTHAIGNFYLNAVYPARHAWI